MVEQLPLILMSVGLNGSAQVLLKKGMRGPGPRAFRRTAPVSGALAILLDRWVFAGLVCFGASLVAWLGVLARVEVSAAYPFFSLGYVITAVAGRLLFGERLSAVRVGGILLICAGVALVAQS